MSQYVDDDDPEDFMATEEVLAWAEAAETAIGDGFSSMPDTESGPDFVLAIDPKTLTVPVFEMVGDKRIYKGVGRLTEETHRAFVSVDAKRQAMLAEIRKSIPQEKLDELERDAAKVVQHYVKLEHGRRSASRAESFLTWIVPVSQQDEWIGDLMEKHAESIVPKHGRVYATLWLWWHVASYVRATPTVKWTAFAATIWKLFGG